MKVGVLFSGGKDSCYASFLAKKAGYDICCLISIVSENPDSFMFQWKRFMLCLFLSEESWL